jgi:hypothetical protein
MRIMSVASALLAMSAAAGPAAAVTIQFNGSRSNIDAPGPASPRCGSRTTTTVVHNPPTATSAGVSNLGAFTPTLSHCIQLPLSNVAENTFDLGQFTFDFGMGDTLFGTYGGVINFLAPRVYTVTQSHVFTGGTGYFFGATGGIDSSGTLSFVTGRPTVEQTFAGAITLGGVPEPSIWLTLIAGFGVIGVAMRRRRTVFAFAGRTATA